MPPISAALSLRCLQTIHELTPEDASLVAQHLKSQPETVYIAASGVNISNESASMNLYGRCVAIEWIREESRPKAGEPECNTYRYLFGLTANGECFGYDVTEPESSPSNQQVGDHWTTLDEICKRYPFD